MNVLLIEGIGVPHGTFVAKIPDVGSSMKFEPIGLAHIDLDVVPIGEGRLRIYKSTRMFAVKVTTWKGREIFQQWVEPAGIAGKTGISEIRVPMPKRERRFDGREYILLTDLMAFLGPASRYFGPAELMVTPEGSFVRAADAKDACILAFVGDGT